MQQQAIITKIEGNKLTCTVSCSEACGSCAAKKVCGVSESDSGKAITLISYNTDHKVGDTINVEVSNAMGLRAVLYAYLIPIIIIIGAVLGLQAFGISELICGISAIGALALYYICIKLFSIGGSVSISIIEDNSK